MNKSKIESSQAVLQQADVSGSCGTISKKETVDQLDEEDSYWVDEDNFQCCDNCDLPDACRDFGCAIRQGLKKNLLL